MNNKIDTATYLLVAIATVAPAAAARADTTLEYQLEAGGAYTNNINRVAADGADETVGIVGGTLDFAVETRRTNGEVGVVAEHRIYTKNSNDDETLASIDAEFDFELIDNLLTWNVDESFGQVLVDVFEPENPLNREDVNVFSTGPVLSLPFNATNRMLFSAGYRDISYEDSPQNNDGLFGQLGYERTLNANRSVGLNVSSQAVDFDRAIDPDFDRHSVSVTFNSETSRSALGVELGVNQVDFGSNRDESDGELIRVNFSRDLSARLNLAFDLAQELSDSGQLFGQFLSDRTLDNFVNQSGEFNAVADAIEQRSAGIRLGATQRSGTAYVAVRYLDIDFQASNDQDRETTTLEAGVNRDLAGGWRVGVTGFLNKGDFADGRSDDNLQVRLTVSRQLTRTLSLNASIAHSERDSSNSVASFDEDTARLTVIWQPQRSRGGR